MHRYRSQVKNLVECQSMDSEMMACETPADKMGLYHNKFLAITFFSAEIIALLS